MESKIILASSSPRRKQLLESLGLTFEVIVSGYDENSYSLNGYDFAGYCREQALRKGLWIVEQGIATPEASIIVSADTVVVSKNELLEKPRDAADAEMMLRSLSDSWHIVYTGLCMHFLTKEGDLSRRDQVFKSELKFRSLTDSEIHRYIDSGEPFGRSGSYSIQGYGASFVREIKGSYTSVVGLPLAETLEWIRENI